MHRSGTGKGSRMGPGVLVRWVFPSFTVMGRRGGEVERSPWLWEGAAFGVPTVLPSGVEEVGGGGGRLCTPAAQEASLLQILCSLSAPGWY